MLISCKFALLMYILYIHIRNSFFCTSLIFNTDQGVQIPGSAHEYKLPHLKSETLQLGR